MLASKGILILEWLFVRNAILLGIYNFFKVKINFSLTCNEATSTDCLSCKSDRTYNSVTHACDAGANTCDYTWLNKN